MKNNTPAEFACALCHCVFDRASFHDHAGATDEETVSLCDSCYATFLEEAKTCGFKINNIGGLEV